MTVTKGANMLTYERVSRRPAGFRCLTGFSTAEFDTLYADIKSRHELAEEERLYRPYRK